MARLRSDSPLARTIVQSFLRFLDTVELAPDVDSEAVLVASQCLADAFGFNVDELSDSVPDLAQLLREHGLDPSYPSKRKGVPDGQKASPQGNPQSPFSNASAGTSNDAVPTSSEVDNIEAGLSDVRLFEQYREGLESAGYFDGPDSATPNYQERVEKAKSIFNETIKRVMVSSTSEPLILAEAFKAQGNDSMSASRYIEAIDLYTMAISLCGENAVYYSNRAAAHTHIGKYDEAIADCSKAIQLDPTYSKAYSRLGLAYYTQGKYQEAIEKGFQKAHALDPNSKSIQENLLAAQQKLTEERDQHQAEPSQQQRAQSNNQNPDSRFSTTIPFNVPLPQGMANLFPAMAANMAAQFAGEHATAREGNGNAPNSNAEESNRQQQTTNNSQGSESRFSSSIPLNIPLPPGMANLFPDVANLAAQFSGGAEHATPTSERGVHGATTNDEPPPEVRLDGSVNVTMDGNQLPPQFAGLMQSMLQMFAGAAPGQMGTQQPNRQGNNVSQGAPRGPEQPGSNSWEDNNR